MKHQSSRDSANRHGNALSRTTVEKIDDSKLIQESELGGFYEERMDEIEHFHPYGMTTHPKAPTGQGEQRQTAEAITVYLGSNRTHGISIVVADRRFRLNNLAEGEVALHDDQGNQVYLSRNVIVVNGTTEVHAQVGDNSHAQLTASKVKLQQGSASVTMKGGKVYLGKEDATHAVQTADGASTNVFATISETDTAMTKATVAKRTDPNASGGGG